MSIDNITIIIHCAFRCFRASSCVLTVTLDIDKCADSDRLMLGKLQWKRQKMLLTACFSIDTTTRNEKWDILASYSDFIIYFIVFLLLSTWYAGASTPYKRWCKCSMEKVRGEVFAAFFRKLRGESWDKFINNINIFNLQRKISAFPRPPSFCKSPPPNLIMYWQNTVSYYCQNNNLLHCYEEQFRKYLQYERYLWLYQTIIISRHCSSSET